MLGIQVTLVDWCHKQDALKEIRHKVFVEEQRVPESLEWDGLDDQCLHLLATAGERAIGCARLIPPSNSDGPAKIGRMAVRHDYRGFGVGRMLMEAAEKEALKRKFSAIQLSAQCHAYGFYSSLGYKAFSKPYDDAAIPHVDMVKPLKAPLKSQSSEPLLNDSDAVEWYELGRDDAGIQTQSLFEAKGYVDLFLSQTERALVLCFKNLDHPLSRYTALHEKIKSLAKNKRYFKVYILLSHGLRPSHHPLVELQERLPSFVDIRIAKTSVPNHWVFDGLGWLDFEGHDVRCCFGDRARVHTFMEKFKSWWDHATPCAEGRELHL